MNTQVPSSSSHPLHHLPALLAALAGLFIVCANNVQAAYAGQMISVTTNSPITPGNSLTFTVTVKNTGTSTWSAASVPGWWITVYGDECSWVNNYDVDMYVWNTVAPGASNSSSQTFTVADDSIPTAPGNYTFWVRTYYPSDTIGNYTQMSGSPMLVSFRVGTAPPPANDNFASAALLAVNSGTINSSSNGATVETGEPAHKNRGPFASVWYKLTPASNGTLSIDTHGSAFDTVLAIYTGSSVGSLTTVASNDDDGSPGNNSGLPAVALTAGTTYRIAVAGYSSTSAGSLVLNWTFTPAVTMTVTFDGQSGTAPSPGTKIVTYNSPYGTLATTSRPGYAFAGWWTAVGGTGTQVTSSTTVAITSAHTLYAAWTVLPAALESWRQANFGSPANTGDGADLNDFDKDGIPNLLEFAFGLNPKANSAGLIPRPQKSGSNLVVSFTEPTGISGITYGAEWSETLLAGSWTAVADTGNTGASPPQHTFSVPIGTKAKLYMRLKVTNPKP